MGTQPEERTIKELSGDLQHRLIHANLHLDDESQSISLFIHHLVISPSRKAIHASTFDVLERQGMTP